MPSFIDVGVAVSEPWVLENVNTDRTDGRTYARTDGHLTRFISYVGRDD